jgi:uncharacterized protein
LTRFFDTLPVLFAMGLAGALHCAGMCGALAALVGGARKPGRFVLYIAGKSWSYMVLGAVAGAAGQTVLKAVPLGWGTRLLAISAGVLLLLAGLESLGAFRALKFEWLAGLSRHIAGLAGAGASGVLLLGAANGLLPCPMVYAFAAMAAMTGSPVWGAATMLVLGLTSALPLAFCSALGGRFARFRTVAAVLMLAMAAIALKTGLFPRDHAHHDLSPSPPAHHHVQ